MGEVLRRYWMPALLSEEMPEADCAPVRVRLLGEDLIAFRDTDGRIGVLDRFCPHRRVDLFFGRNEECGLRCVYHGWKFDVSGNVLDMPAEPANSPMRDEVKIKSYPAMEWGGLIWVYMGDPDHMPDRPPELEWGLVPSTHRNIQKRLQENNYAQGVEGGIDSSHVGILHSLLSPREPGRGFRERQQAIDPRLSFLAQDTAPKFFVRPSDYGMLIGARRKASEEEFYWRITQFLAPFYTMIAPRSPEGPIAGHAWVPIDDYNTWTFTMYWSPDRPLREFEGLDSAKVNVPVLDDGSFKPVHNRSNNYGIDRAMQRDKNSTGIIGIGLQDSAIQETMGPIVDRSREMLGSGDAAIVAWRKLMLALADELESTGKLHQPLQPEIYRVRSAGIVLPRGVDFADGARERMTVA
ncbi:Rieske 2Fe-2S domain-containing protein [Sphingomonas crocodyli]|uniref:Aromatic ring-hydroxylating dioxygenase subunit alpha n=1 Tax=Sphingomonas crocodyli TaxID=1979270 RepID=A0A437M5I1_9SPHN|nr:Rieske 2Fe-2S domain-containing protein [Sphingomonas crocodyli]RVT92948.1 aromatic ring-hydroxylating dioxygenase subunit alpha [Sphingomonas crocodyli]